MGKLATAKMWLLNPDKNPLLNKIVHFFFYDAFCCGENEKEVKKNLSTLKQMGYKGVVLAFAKEIMAEHTSEANATDTAAVNESIEEWKQGNLATLDMLDSDDVLAIK